MAFQIPKPFVQSKRQANRHCGSNDNAQSLQELCHNQTRKARQSHNPIMSRELFLARICSCIPKSVPLPRNPAKQSLHLLTDCQTIQRLGGNRRNKSIIKSLSSKIIIDVSTLMRLLSQLPGIIRTILNIFPTFPQSN